MSGLSFENAPTEGVMATEPARVIGGAIAAVSAIVALLVAFGVDFTADQQAAILGVVATLAPLVAALIIRSRVFSPRTVSKLVPPRPQRPAEPLED